MRAASLLVVCAALAACGSSAHPVASTVPASAATGTTPPAGSAPAATATTPATGAATTPATSTAPTSTSPTTAPPTSPGTPTPARPSLCTAPDLALSVLSQQGAAGHGVIVLALRNTSGHTCHTFGFPGVQFLGAGDNALTTVPTRVTSDFVGPVPERALSLAAGQTASFRLVLSHVTSVPGACATAQALQVIAPDDTQTLRTPLAATECGVVTVSPLQPGLTANPS